MRIVVDRTGNYRYFFTFENTVPPTDATANHAMGWSASDASELYVTGQGAANFPIHPPRNGLWFYASISSDGSNIFGVWALAGGGFVRAQLTYGALTIASMSFGNNSWDERVGAEFAHMRVWKRALSETELYAEMNSPFAVSQKNLDTDILGWNDRRNRAPGGEWTYTAVSGGTVVTPISSDEIWFPKRLTVLAAGNASITNVSPSVLYEGLTNIVITGTGFGATQGTKTVYLDDKLQSIVSWTDTTITFNAVSPNLWNNARLLQVRGT